MWGRGTHGNPGTQDQEAIPFPIPRGLNLVSRKEMSNQPRIFFFLFSSLCP